MKIFLFILLLAFAGLTPANFVWAANPLDVVISEISWMGTDTSSADEWIELYNNTNQDINLNNWGIYEDNGKTLIEPLLNSIPAFSFYIIERTDDTTIPNIPASQEPSSWSGYGLKNSGEHILLIDNKSFIIDDIDCSNAWFAGETKPDYKTMERKNLSIAAHKDNWQASAIPHGTPLAQNSSPEESEPEQNNDNLSPPKADQPLAEITNNQLSIINNQSNNLSSPEPQTIEYPNGIVINEILPSPDGPDAENEWIEIFNQNNFPVNISNWEIADTQGKTKSYFFPRNTIIKAESFLLFPRPQTKITLNNDADGLNLIHPNKTITDSVIYTKAKLNQSYNRINNNWVWSDTLTPGWENIIPDADTKGITKENSVSNADNHSNSAHSEATTAINNGEVTVAVKPIHFTASLLALFSAFSILALKKSLRP